MITTTLPIGKLFELFEKYEKSNFVPEVEQFLTSPMKIQNPNNVWIDVSAAITKPGTGLKVTFSNGDVVHGERKHLISTGSRCVFLETLLPGEYITKASGEVIQVISITPTDDTLFYDITVNSEDHLYQTANGIVHHNTECAKLLANNLSMKLLRYDMGEFQERHTVAKFIGAPPGYVGYEDGNLGGGMLVSDIEKNPNAVILFDEIEKAHPDVTNVLLALMDEGFVTSSNGKRADARNAVVILTSNLGAAANEQNAIGFGREQQRTGEDDKAVKDFFKPEFRNRLDGICKFNSLDHNSVKKVLFKFIGELNQLLEDKKVKVELAESAIEYLAKEGFDPKMGARPMARKINTWLKVPLSKKILFETVPTGSTVMVCEKDGIATFKVTTDIVADPEAISCIDENGYIHVPTK